MNPLRKFGDMLFSPYLCRLKRQIMEQETKYEAAFAELQTIVRKMENDELDIDQMAEELKRAQELIKLCKDKLTKTDEEIKKILAQD